MSKHVSVGDFHAGPYCGARLLSVRDWKLYGFFRKTSTGFSIGPLYFWKEKIA